jgi:hypothetical protein
MTAALLLVLLRERGVRLRVDGDSLHYSARKGTMDAETVALLRLHKAGLLALLVAPCPCGPCSTPGAIPHGPRCHCGPCLDADPKWEAWRREMAEECHREAWVNPDLDEEDRALLRAVHRLDRERSEWTR